MTQHPKAARRPAASLLRGLITVGLIGFGGGSALIPVVEKELVQKRGLLDDHLFTRHTIVANITPGALPVKLSMAAGQAVRGPWLAVVAALVVAAPGVVATLGLMSAAVAVGPVGIRAISAASVGISAFIIVLLIGYILKVHQHAGARLPAFLLITVASALATGPNSLVLLVSGLAGRPLVTHLPHLSAVQLIGFALVVIVVVALVRDRPAVRGPRPRQARNLRPTWLGTAFFLLLAALGVAVLTAVRGIAGFRIGTLLALSSVTSFGGGEAYIGVADGFFVRTALVDRDVFYTQLVPIANALPGPILVKVGAGVGYLFGASEAVWQAWLLGTAAVLVTVGACCAVAMPVLGLYEDLRDHPVVRSIGAYILPVICGLLIAVSATMLEVSAHVAEDAGADPVTVLWLSLGAVVVMTVLHVRRLVPDLVMLAVAGIVSLLALGW
jgi:chromate transporter